MLDSFQEERGAYFENVGHEIDAKTFLPSNDNREIADPRDLSGKEAQKELEKTYAMQESYREVIE